MNPTNKIHIFKTKIAEDKQALIIQLEEIGIMKFVIIHGVSYRTVKKYLMGDGYSYIPRQCTDFSEENIAEMNRLYESGMSFRNIGKRFNTSGPTVGKHIKKEIVRTKVKSNQKERYKKRVETLRFKESPRVLNTKRWEYKEEVPYWMNKSVVISMDNPHTEVFNHIR